MDRNFVDDTYIIDLSYAVSASDIVFELSSIIDNDMAKSQKIALKLGNVDLNQSQLLSIRSLISSINSTVAFLETNSAQTELSAINLGIIVSTIKQAEPAVEATAETVEPAEIKEPEYVPSYGYVKLDDHIESEASEEEETEEMTDTEEAEDEVLTSSNDGVVVEDFVFKAGAKEEIVEEDLHAEISEEIYSEDFVSKEEIHNDTAMTEEQADEIIEAKTEDIQDALSDIYASEVKLESILENEQAKQEPEQGVISAEVVKQAVREEEKSYTEADFEIDHFSTTYIKQTLRSGQIVNYDGNVVIIGDCHPGSEVSASGDITVWGILSGIAHAGAKGNPRARVRALKMNAIQLRIADCFARKPDGMNTIFPERTSTFTPEEARILNDEIVIFKIND